MVNEEAQRARDIVRSLLNFARADTPKRQSTDFNQLIDEAIFLVYTKPVSQRITLEQSLSPLPEMFLDINQIKQVIVNLLNNAVQAIIKERCTAVHPSVEWRFSEAALPHLDRLRMGQASELEPIIFKDVVPLFAQTDIRGSSDARNRSIQSDLIEQLTLAGNVMNQAVEARNWPLLQEFQYRIDTRVKALRQGLSSDDETTVSEFKMNS